MTVLGPGVLHERARGAVDRAPVLVACSHGTSSVVGQRAVRDLVDAVALRRPDLDVLGCCVDVQQPDVPTTLAEIGDEPVHVVPLLLSAGFHVYVDLAEAAAEAPDAVVRPALGPDPRLVRQLVTRLDEAGLRPEDAVVLAVAGSSDARAVDDCEVMGRMLGHAIGREVLVGYISAVKPALPDAVETARSRSGGRRVAVATYLLAPGYFADLAGRAGADVVTEPLLSAADPAPHEMVELVVERFGM
ncbi:CbiX/SirB N-terminal domain-containing protein [Sanguibacter sp. Leaf3]|uniref:sirohydrochlorin chelatase n=1 Tax=Sanguibacter sp. Leaf3 TaxID=1736209 RepID=UPI0009EAFB4F